MNVRHAWSRRPFAYRTACNARKFSARVFCNHLNVSLAPRKNNRLEANLTDFRSPTVPHSEEAKDSVVRYKRAVEQGTSETYEQTRANEADINTDEFALREYAKLCRGDTSQVPVFSLFWLCCKEYMQSHSNKTRLVESK